MQGMSLGKTGMHNKNVLSADLALGIIRNERIGTWVIEVDEGKRWRMYIDPVMAALLDCPEGISPEDTYDFFHKGVTSEADVILTRNFEAMASGKESEVQYAWMHPDGSRRIIRCGGTRDWSYKDGIRCRGIHSDISNTNHIDEGWRLRSMFQKSYINHYNAKEAQVIVLVNMANDHYDMMHCNPEMSILSSTPAEGRFSSLIDSFSRFFPDKPYSDKLKDLKDFDFLDRHFKESPVFREHFPFQDRKGNLRYYRVTANKLHGDEMIVSLEDKTLNICESIVLSTISSRLVGGFILNLELDRISVVKLTPFFDYLDGYDTLRIAEGIELLCPHMDEEFREGWKQFANLNKLKAIFKSQKRVDYPFKTVINGEHTWLRASFYAIDKSLSSKPAVALTFRNYSGEELEAVYQTEALIHENEKLEREYRLIKGITSQYVSLKVVNIDGRFTTIYKDLDLSYGWERDENSNYWDNFVKMMKEHCHPEDLERMLVFGDRKKLVSRMKGRRRVLERFRFKVADGTYKWMDLVLVRFDKYLHTELSEFAYAFANVDVEVHRDMEYAKALEQALISKEESRLKTQFVNNISHDIRTPLNAVIGYSQLLAMAGEQLSEAEKTEYMQYIENSGELLTMLIDDILSISDIEHDILKINLTRACCNTICQKAVSCSTMRVLKGVELSFSSAYPDDFEILTDPKRVQQILINMISNSCKATTQGWIRVYCGPSAKEGFIDFVVTDTGCGVSPEKAEEIFKRFVSVENNENGVGHGLGLDICQKLSHRMGGSIWLDQSYTGGARFVLTLPVAQ